MPRKLSSPATIPRDMPKRKPSLYYGGCYIKPMPSKPVMKSILTKRVASRHAQRGSLIVQDLSMFGIEDSLISEDETADDIEEL